MRIYLLALATAAYTISMPGTAFAKHHESRHGDYKCTKMKGGKMKCCKKVKDGKIACHMMDRSKMKHSKH